MNNVKINVDSGKFYLNGKRISSYNESNVSYDLAVKYNGN